MDRGRSAIFDGPSRTTRREGGAVVRLGCRGNQTVVTHAFSVDVEDWYHGIPISTESKAAAEHRLEKGLDPLLDILAAAGVRGTFFILGPLVQRHARSI